ncbi:phage holin family protein [Peijinzhouia sedimentorum]
MSISLILSGIAAVILQVLGINWIAALLLFLTMIVEVQSGIKASGKRGEPKSSMKMSRFTFKLFVYLIVIATPYNFATSYADSGNTLGAQIFEWIHVALILQVWREYTISILENLATINGKPKEQYLNLFEEKLKSFLK